MSHGARGLTGLLVFALFVGLPGASACTAPQLALKGVTRAEPLDVAAISLPDVANRGTPLRMKPPWGNLLLVYFGYTSCPDICPATMIDVRVALDDLPRRLADRVSVAMVTVDPERDTPEVLTNYLVHFFERSHALRTTDQAALAAAAGAFGVRWEVEPHHPGTSYAVSHTAFTYVVDDTGQVIVEWPFGFDTQYMTSDLSTLLARRTR
jgi:protein SCO1